MENQAQKAAQALYDWQYCNSNSFFNMLFTLISKADPNNRSRLEDAFPFEVSAYLEWCNTPTPEEFYEKYGLASEGR